ncbi:putative S-adenosyl-L-methionine-dependent methyltransferase [Blattamonas nauphoetae]|uniref:S-adenosyl-L-methionine-dependent methyltransferase n=1 Tax=Blattamonas nauphoetae TaxID=2049346 RepID=A0ABQ9X1I1_9EUKA|nr:putative S-adenosyl-L-methionine-dependent methyltransferase [Blattamonas nauphoetae]
MSSLVYHAATRVLQNFLDEKGSLKHLVYNTTPEAVADRRKYIFKIVFSTVKWKPVLEAIFEEVRDSLGTERTKEGTAADKLKQIVSREKVEAGAFIYTFELLLSSDKRGRRALEKQISKHGEVGRVIFDDSVRGRLEDAVERVRVKKGVESVEELISKEIAEIDASRNSVPVYMRVNGLVTSTGEFEKTLVESKEFRLVREEGEGGAGGGEADVDEECGHLRDSLHVVLRSDVRVRPGLFARDRDVGGLYVFAPGVLGMGGVVGFGSAMVGEMRVVVQDKASCFPARVLLPPLGGKAVDFCAAPGNKTLQLVEMVGETGSVVAFERDGRRAGLLRKRLLEGGCCVEGGVEGKGKKEGGRENGRKGGRVRVCERDVLGVEWCDPVVREVEWGLLDPSCSGSGMRRTVETVLRGGGEREGGEAGQAEAERVSRLAGLQLRLLRHVAEFPSLRVLVYSTCSVHEKENEEVVGAFLRSREAQAEGWVLRKAGESEGLKRKCEWNGRVGLKEGVGLTEEQAESVIRFSSEEHTNGFFVAKFERVGWEERRKERLREAESEWKRMESEKEEKMEEGGRVGKERRREVGGRTEKGKSYGGHQPFSRKRR